MPVRQLSRKNTYMVNMKLVSFPLSPSIHYLANITCLKRLTLSVCLSCCILKFKFYYFQFAS